MVGLVWRDGCARDVRDALVQSGSSGARGTCGAQRDARRVSPAEKELGVCRRGRDGARCDRRQCARSGPWRCTGVDAPGRVRRLDHGRGEDINMSYSGDGEVMA